ncbi:flavodoxin [Ligilactobacillus acidipiscis]|jgi:flavodoxin short chain|nr:flavodoxin [Ligilactobacillus acidipiscis]MCI1924354.1 flavodoxin [Ligilactobacillus acidipiscis]MCI1953781.1 flavodoxin [Ligilactobacillus acidipiscis]WEV56197.1 flavodoxin [Ligilactobacillus acidipiscis]SFV41021.1 Flavodoxin [Ligilactobacillus acidipiscis]GAW63318.1 flavodoxin [Ligilactobacillus acidipiscis]
MPTAKVVFATITGNNEDIADIVSDNLEDQGFEIEQIEISQAEIEDFEEADICVICPYTYDEGALPDEGLDFYDDLKEEADLSGKVYGVAGSGDTFYEGFYCTAVDDFSNAMKKAHAIQGAPDLKINLAPDSDEDLAALDDFSQKLVNTYKEQQNK